MFERIKLSRRQVTILLKSATREQKNEISFDSIIMLSTNQNRIKIDDACEMSLIKDLHFLCRFFLPYPHLIVTHIYGTGVKEVAAKNPLLGIGIHANRTQTFIV